MAKDENKNIILNVEEKSKAEKLGIEKGDKLLKVNGQQIEDIIEYMFLIADEYLEIEIEKKDGTIKKYTIEKEFHEDLGIEFKNPIIDQARSCRNKCIFCFIDQLPPDMRKTLYFKDDDSRLSFFQGNFVTLTNMSDEDINKIIRYRISPINVSIHTTDEALRVEMLKNKNAGKLYERLVRLADAGIRMNGQIVLCPNVNDGEHLDKTIEDLSNLYPNIESLAVVPVGITKYRDGLYPMKIFNENSAHEVIEKVEKWKNILLEKIGTRFVHLSDEFYVIANKKLPNYESYEGFGQLENGVGLMVKFEQEIMEHLEKNHMNHVIDRQVSVPTGASASAFMKKICREIEKRFEKLKINVFEIKNEFFGETITVTGLITATDLIKQLKEKDLGDQLMISSCMLKSDEPIFLDDMTIEDLHKELGVKIVVTEVDGADFIDKIIN